MSLSGEQLAGGNSAIKRVDNDFYATDPKTVERLKNENNRLRYELSLTRGEKGICLEIDGKNMTDVYTLQKEINEKDAIIKFLKKELQHKTSYRQVMKRQYRELRQKYDALYLKIRRCETCKYCKLAVTVNETIGNECEHYFNGCNNNPFIPFSNWELDEGRFKEEQE